MNIEKLAIPRFTEHARARMNQRDITERAIRLVLAYAQPWAEEEKDVYRLSDAEIIQAQAQGVPLQQLRDLTVVMTSDGCVITAYWCSKQASGLGRAG